MSVDKPTVVLKRFFGNSLSEYVHIKTFEMICGWFYWASSEHWEVKSINCWGCSVSPLWRQGFKRQSDAHIKPS